MIRVLVADDHAVVRKGLVQVVGDAYDLEVAGEAATGDEVLSLAARQPFDVAVVDISMPGRSGIDVLEQLRASHPRLPVLILSAKPEEQYAVRLIRMGAAGYISKDRAPEELVSAIRTVAQGLTYVSPAVASQLAEGLAATDTRPHERLSDREFEVLLLIGAGRTPTQIAQELHLSVKTVSTYRTRILDKMGLSTTAELMKYAISEGLTS
jgi:DNA-binding NarL/FixJ family response regulator